MSPGPAVEGVDRVFVLKTISLRAPMKRDMKFARAAFGALIRDKEKPLVRQIALATVSEDCGLIESEDPFPQPLAARIDLVTLLLCTGQKF